MRRRGRFVGRDVGGFRCRLRCDLRSAPRLRSRRRSPSRRRRPKVCPQIDTLDRGRVGAAPRPFRRRAWSESGPSITSSTAEPRLISPGSRWTPISRMRAERRNCERKVQAAVGKIAPQVRRVAARIAEAGARTTIRTTLFLGWCFILRAPHGTRAGAPAPTLHGPWSKREGGPRTGSHPLDWLQRQRLPHAPRQAS
jgi:hypothetical protein